MANSQSFCGVTLKPTPLSIWVAGMAPRLSCAVGTTETARVVETPLTLAVTMVEPIA
jgi:hypothetical protein